MNLREMKYKPRRSTDERILEQGGIYRFTVVAEVVDTHPPSGSGAGEGILVKVKDSSSCWSYLHLGSTSVVVERD